MVEARQKVDQFDANISSEGVIVYQVQTTDPLGQAQNNTAPVKLLTETALKPGQKFTSASGIAVQVKNAIPGEFNVRIERPADPRCADIKRRIAAIDEELNEPGLDVEERKRLLRARGQLRTQAQQLGCS